MRTHEDQKLNTQEDAALSALVKSRATRYAAPPDLADRIRQRIDAPAIPSRSTARPKTDGSRWRRWFEPTALFGAGAAAAGAIVAVLALSFGMTPAQDAVIDEITSSHVRSLMASHLSDVASSDHHTVKPWFAGKLDFSPPVYDLAAEGFPLTGGRLDYVAGRPVAALVYKPGLHVINLFVWPAQDGKAIDLRVFERQGFNLVHWTQDGMQAWAVSDMNAAELKSFATLVRERMGGAPAPS